MNRSSFQLAELSTLHLPSWPGLADDSDQIRPDQIGDLLQVPHKPVLTCFTVGLSVTKPSPPPGFLVSVYGNGGGAMEIDHVLIDGHWRMIQNCRVYRSAQFLNTDHRLVVATLKLTLNPGEW